MLSNPSITSTATPPQSDGGGGLQEGCQMFLSLLKNLSMLSRTGTRRSPNSFPSQLVLKGKEVTILSLVLLCLVQHAFTPAHQVYRKHGCWKCPGHEI
ncbi:hypothetical protein E2C01_000841 [Portunus trituberculatus]|uniref:Uncharacterized protein n=1 Tax=Portunus trituberculatus TaxID=210409 RepID=A0A5B7CG47_PORTR|nr:hypothetical protein [Portunus trituberculatus]